MDYTELAEQFIQNSYHDRKFNQQRQIVASMRGENFVLFYLSRQGDSVLPGDISTVMNISSARIAVALNGLEKKGLITRRIDKTDRRKILVNLTPEGIERANSHKKSVLDRTKHMLEMLGERDAKEFVRIVGRLSELSSEITCHEPE